MNRTDIQRRWYIKNKEKVREWRLRWYVKNKEKLREYNQLRWKLNPEFRARKKATLKVYRSRLREKALGLLGGKCKNCGFSDIRALQIDHINGNGRKEKMKITTLYNKEVVNSIILDEKKYQLLCANCNWIKRVVNKEHT